MSSLFLKIFLSYWLSQALLLVLAILVTLAARQGRESSGAESQQSEVVGKAVQAYEQGGPNALHSYLSETRESRKIWAYLLDAQGHELSGQDLPRWAESVAKGIRPVPREFWVRFTPSPFRRQTFRSSSGRQYLLVAMLPSGPFGPNGIPGLGILIGVVSSGIVCYLLALYLTSPIARLREATRRLAEGDLTARAGSGGGLRRGDELAGLVRDFDAMAERLEESVNAQSRLLNDISHELRSPLARLNVAAALAHRRAGPEAHSALERIDLEADRLNELIGGLLTIARLDSGNDSRQKSRIHLGEMIEEIAADADFEAQGRNCGVKSVIKQDCLVTGAP